uniref:Uncharacterized protein n=1 Tax=Strombidium inclinatum TaxID=197538 RepID=A0A7S3MYJ5_9SPIT
MVVVTSSNYKPVDAGDIHTLWASERRPSRDLHSSVVDLASQGVVDAHLLLLGLAVVLVPVPHRQLSLVPDIHLGHHNVVLGEDLGGELLLLGVHDALEAEDVLGLVA